jgi:catechol 2,3-dioxygenase-like lactoylglutathione lyase family enzyme
MTRARHFYQSIFGLEIMENDERFCAFRVGHDVLLLFTEGGSNQPVQLQGGTIPPHETLGAGHFAFAISPDTLAEWRALLGERGIKIASEVRWERGGVSLYFRDSDNNLAELVTPGTWANY